MPRNKTINTEWLLDNVKYEQRFDQNIARRRQYIRQIIHRGVKIKLYLGSFQLFKSANVALTG